MPCNATAAAMRREQAVELLRRGWPGGAEARYDAAAAAVLCRMRRFTPGLLFLYDRMRLHREVLQVRLPSPRPGPASTTLHVRIITPILRLQHEERQSKSGSGQIDEP